MEESFQEKIIFRALKDRTFKKQLIENPKKIIEEELKIQIPQEIEIIIHEDTERFRHFVIPNSYTDEIQGAELQTISGGRGVIDRFVSSTEGRRKPDPIDSFIDFFKNLFK